MASANQKPLCLYGAGGHGRGVSAQIESRTGRKPVFADSGGYCKKTPIAFDKLEAIKGHNLIVTIGALNTRRELQTAAQGMGLELTHFIADPNAYFCAKPGAGSVVLAGAVVNAETIVGAGVIINNGAVVEHGCIIGDFTHIAPGAVVCGDVWIQSDVWIGANATILQGLKIASGTVVGAGAVVTKDIMSPGVYVGQPARLLRVDEKG